MPPTEGATSTACHMYTCNCPAPKLYLPAAYYARRFCLHTCVLLPLLQPLLLLLLLLNIHHCSFSKKASPAADSTAPVLLLRTVHAAAVLLLRSVLHCYSDVGDLIALLI